MFYQNHKHNINQSNYTFKQIQTYYLLHRYSMGGDYYPRDVVQTKPEIVYGNTVIGKSTTFSANLDPKIHVKNGGIDTNVATPIVLAVDVTGSMGDWSNVIYDKIPLFYQTVCEEEYVNNIALSFCAIGDQKYDEYPLQASVFSQSTDCDKVQKNIYFQKGGGGNAEESYDLSVYFYNKYCRLNNTEIAFFFIYGDQGFYEQSEGSSYNKVFGQSIGKDKIKFREEMERLRSYYNVFHLRKPYSNSEKQKKINKQWCQVLGEQRVMIFSPKAVIDIMIGIIALTSGALTLEEYVEDMEDRGQDNNRRVQVFNALKKYSDGIKNGKVKIVGKPKSLKQISVEEFRAQWKKRSEHEKNQKRKQINEKQMKYKDAPSKLICQLTGLLMQKPVRASDGGVYERRALRKWFRHNNLKGVVKGKDFKNKTVKSDSMSAKVAQQWLNNK